MAHHVHDVTPELGNYTTTRDVTPGCVMTNPAHERQLLSADYARAMAELEATRPNLARTVREYVKVLHAENAMRRVQANRLRSEAAAALELVRRAR